VFVSRGEEVMVASIVPFILCDVAPRVHPRFAPHRRYFGHKST